MHFLSAHWVSYWCSDHLPYVSFSFRGETVKCPFLAFDNFTFHCFSPSLVSACSLSAFSLKCRTASWVLKCIKGMICLQATFQSYIYLACIISGEKALALGANRISTLLKDSNENVWTSGESWWRSRSRKADSMMAFRPMKASEAIKSKYETLHRCGVSEKFWTPSSPPINSSYISH